MPGRALEQCAFPPLVPRGDAFLPCDCEMDAFPCLITIAVSPQTVKEPREAARV